MNIEDIMEDCIICRSPKLTFSIEHVFPATINGAYTISSVCKDCNKKMGDNIDTPFSNLVEILLLRDQMNLKRGNRKIKNPFSGQYSYKDKQYIVSRKEEGFSAELKPNMELVEHEGGYLIKISMSTDFFKSEEQVIKMFSKAVKEKTNLDLENAVIIDKQESREPYVTIKESDPHNPRIFEFLKIAYETGVSLIKDYYDDPIANIYSAMLEKGDFNREYVNYFNPNGEVNLKAFEILRSQKFLWDFPCFIVIMTIENHGLVSVIRIFNSLYTLILSPKETYLDGRIIFLVNDSINKRFYSGFLKTPLSFTFSFNYNDFSQHQKNELSNEDGNLIFKHSDNIPIYDSNGVLVVDNIDGLLIDVYNNEGKYLKNPKLISTINSVKHNLSKMDVFIKSNKSGILYKLQEVIFHYS
jgi:hypothetical protein